MIRIDARGMRCPWPAIRLARALRTSDAAVEIVADDPAAPRELAAVAQAAGRTIRSSQDAGETTFTVAALADVGNGINISFTPEP